MCSANENNGTATPPPVALSQNPSDYGNNLKIIDSNDQIKELQTIIRDKNTTRSDFKFYADRLIRLVIEESLNQLPYSDCSVITPTGAIYDGLRYRSGNCGVSIIRSGEAMEQGLRDCCRSIRIGRFWSNRTPKRTWPRWCTPGFQTTSPGDRYCSCTPSWQPATPSYRRSAC